VRRMVGRLVIIILLKGCYVSVISAVDNDDVGDFALRI